MKTQSGFNLEQILREGIEASPDCFAILDHNDVVIYCNDAFGSVFGLTRDEAIGQTNESLLRHSWESKTGIIIDTDNFDLWYNRLKKIQKEKLQNRFETDLTDGRWLKMTRMTLDCGYTLLAGIEITDLKNTQASLQKANEEIARLANTDQLTGVHNRRSFELLAQNELNVAKRYKQQLSILLLDIDFFKKINDVYGHEGGDDVLREFARLCKISLRQADSLCRIGGEEFAILLPMTDMAGAKVVAEQIRSNISSSPFYLQVAKSDINISVSIGVSTLVDMKQSVRDLIVQADRALYTAKHNGRNQVAEYSSDMRL